MRHEAKKMNGYLSQEGLKFNTTRVRVNGKIERTHNGTLVPCYTEKAIFNALRFRFLKPQERNL